LVPSAFITHTSELPLRVLSNTICLPVGDQEGSPSKPGTLVSGRAVANGCRAAGFITQMSLEPDRRPIGLGLYSKAIHLPFGDQAGSA
jgi:hypothetical protein